MLKKLFSNQKSKQVESKKELNLMDIEEGYTVVEIKDSLEAWSNVEESTVKKVLVTNNKMFSSYRKGEIITLSEYLGDGRYRIDKVGGIIRNPLTEKISDIIENKFLTIPYE